ncbi:MAG: FtsX-like permease family protein, partial [Phycisphaerae bacterium]|nr:FtsX-like permease family protein [Phycisphaerae bacterium]
RGDDGRRCGHWCGRRRPIRRLAVILNPFFYVKAIALALSQIWANKTRSLLTALGIIVGVGSVCGVIAALTGFEGKVLKEFETFGASRIFIFPNRPDLASRQRYPWQKVRLKSEEAAAIGAQCPSVRSITPISEITQTAESELESLEAVSIVGIWPSWHEIENRQVISGRPFSQIDIDSARQVCLINKAAIGELALPSLSEDDLQSALGQHILLGGRRFLIVGVVETIQGRMFGMSTSSTEVFIPFSVVEKLQDRDFFMRFAAMALSPQHADEARAEITHVMRRARGIGREDPDTFRVEAIDQYIDQFKKMAAAITAIAGGIVGISLLVGGIGIMNIMLVSVSERTREIGLRKAVGATPAAILLQFLLEAVTLCLVGGFVGVAGGKLIAFAMTLIPGAGLEHADIPMWAVAIAFGFSAMVGVVFGMFPAIKASRLDPIEALRHE